ncbi:DNA-binding response regulator [Lentibacillus sp. N15]|uniref:DNA-binding response regulator n=1 Tax=Lentibacillus songyuanensis TaxID=3136161 RepID=UPI0031B9E47F
MNKKQIESALRDYNWMMNEIKRQRKFIDEDIRVRVTAQMGEESDMPKAQGITSDPVANEVARRDEKYSWLNKLEAKVSFIQKRMHVITDEREIAVLGCMLDGMSMAAIGKHMGLSRTNIYGIKESIVHQILHFEHFEHILHNEHIEQRLPNQKCTV